MINIELIDSLGKYQRHTSGSSDAEKYGCGKAYGKMGFLPNFLPLSISSFHGVVIDFNRKSDVVKTQYPIMVVFSERIKQEWQKYSKVPCHVVEHPYVFYKRKMGWKKKPNAKGSVFFYAHSTLQIDIRVDAKKLIRVLKKLPKEFHPIKVCFHYVDVLKGDYLIFEKAGFECVTAGHMLDPDYIDNFYQILLKSKYCLSNLPGSYMFYAVEAGIPFSIIGDKPVLVNKSDLALKKGKIVPLEKDYGKKVYQLFKGLNTKISKDQMNLVLPEIKSTYAISRWKFGWLAYIALLKHMVAHTNFSSIHFMVMSFMFKILPIRIRNWLYIHRFGLRKDNLIFTHLKLNEKVVMHQCAKNKNGKVYVEIGSFLGASACFIANAMPKDAKLYCIDTWGNHAMKKSEDDPEHERDTWPEFKANTKKYQKKIVPIRAWSHEAIGELKKQVEYVDFLFIDGDHSYEAVLKDWKLYSPLLKPGSLVAFHDTGWAEGVMKVVRENVFGRSKLEAKLPNMEIYRMTR